MSEAQTRRKARLGRHRRIRKIVFGSPDRPRLCVFRSGKHIYAQIVDDVSGRSLGSVSTLSKAIREETRGMKKTDASRAVGKKIAEVAKEKGVSEVRFDRGGFLYHGRIKAVADGAREGGLKF